MQKVTPHLWYDKEAKEAAAFYCSLFPKDKYGLSWQVSAAVMDEMMSKGTEEQVRRVTRAFLPMKKFDLEALKKAYDENKKNKKGNDQSF